MKGKYLFDTHIYDLILDSGADLDVIANKGDLFITNIQQSEIKNIGNLERKTKLLHILEVLNLFKFDLESGIWLDDIYWDDDQIWIDNISPACQSLLGNTINTHRWKDALIGAVAEKHNLTLVTNDQKFQKRTATASVQTLSFADFLLE
jgi:predicted nucleic acid-binding protein